MDTEFACFVLAVLSSEKRKKRKKTRQWTRSWLARRGQYGLSILQRELEVKYSLYFFVFLHTKQAVKKNRAKVWIKQYGAQIFLIDHHCNFTLQKYNLFHVVTWGKHGAFFYLQLMIHDGSMSDRSLAMCLTLLPVGSNIVAWQHCLKLPMYHHPLIHYSTKRCHSNKFNAHTKRAVLFPWSFFLKFCIVIFFFF